MIGNVKMQTIKRRTGQSLTGDRPLFLALLTGHASAYLFNWPVSFLMDRLRK